MLRAVHRAATRWRHSRDRSFSIQEFLALPPLGGYRTTLKRRLNLYRGRYEFWRGRTRLRAFPTRLVVEPANGCNLRCPYCITGAGGQGRPRAVMSLELYRKLLDELGDYLFEIEAFHWGEPLLNQHIVTMVEEASGRGIATTINTNFSLPFDAGCAERLVASGLTELTVSIDGASQETYEQYRVGGHLERVRENCRLLAAAKRRRRTATPRFNLEFHVFPHNVGDVEGMRTMASELEMNLRLFKGVVPGADWDTAGAWEFCVAPKPVPCIFLWGTAVVSTDGGVLACRGAFYAEDDMGRIARRPGDGGAPTFRAVWNGPRFQAARRFYRQRSGSVEERRQICFECPNTIMYERWKAHRAAGGGGDSFDIGYSLNGIWNYFWNRRPAHPLRHHLDAGTRRPPA